MFIFHGIVEPLVRLRDPGTDHIRIGPDDVLCPVSRVPVHDNLLDIRIILNTQAINRMPEHNCRIIGYCDDGNLQIQLIIRVLSFIAGFP